MSTSKDELPVDFTLDFKRYYPLDFQGTQTQKILAKVSSRKSSQRRPLNLCVVLDTSISMRKNLKMVQDAIEGLIDLMKVKDKFHLVTFGSEAEVVFKEVAGGATGLIKQARHAVRKLKAKGATNMMAGLELGKQVLQDSQKIDAKAKVKKDFVPVKRDFMMFVFCDGLVNKWPKKYSKKQQRSTTVENFVSDMNGTINVTASSFGFTSAFDSDLMLMIAEAGCGHYYHVDGALTSKEETNKIKICFEKEFHLASLARIEKSILKITPMNGSSITSIHGFDKKSIKNGIKLGRLFDSDTRNILIDANVVPVHNKPAFSVELHGFEIGVSTKVELLCTKQFNVQLTNNPELYNIQNEDIDARSELNEVIESGEEIERMISNNSGDKDDEIAEALEFQLKKVSPLRKKLVEARFVHTQLENCLKLFVDDWKAAIKILRNQKELSTQTLETMKSWGSKK